MRILAFYALMMLWLAACGSSPQAPAPVVVPATVASVTTAFGAVTGLANGQAQTTVTVTALDAYANPLANRPVSVAITGNQVVVGAVMTQTITGTTNAQGVFTAILTYVAADGVTVTATVDGVAGQATPAPNPTVANIVLNASPASGVVADGYSGSYAINAQLLDAGGNAIANETAVFSASSAQNGQVALSAQSALSGATGVATVNVFDTSAVDDQVTVTVTVGVGASAIARTLTLPFLGSGTGSNISPNGKRLTISLAPSSVPADGVTAVNVTVHAFDTYTATNAVGIPLTLTQNARATIALPTTVNTDAAGNAVFSVSNTNAETVTLTARDAAGSSTVSTLTFTPAVAALQMTPSKSSFIADGVDLVTLTLTATGTQGPVANEQIRLSSTFATTALPAFVTTNASGVATATLKDTVSGHLQITASTRNGGQLPGVVQNKVIDLYAAVATPQILVDAAASPFLADGFTTGHPVTVTVKNGAGVVQASQPIAFTFDSYTATSSIVAANQPGGSRTTFYTDANGVISLFVADSVAELTHMTATATDGTAITTPIQFVSAAADKVGLTPSASVVAPGTTVTANAVVVNAANVTLANARVQFDVYTAAGNHLGPVFANTAANGVASTQFVLSSLGVTDIYASLPLNPAATTAVSTAQVQVIVPNAQILMDSTASPFLADGVTAGHLVRLQVRDVQGVAAANQPLTVDFYGNTNAGASLSSVNTAGVSPLQVVSDAAGVVDVYVSDSIAEQVTMRVTTQDGYSTVSTPFWFVAANPSSIAVTLDKANANPNGVDPIVVTAIVKDAGGVPVQNAWIRFWTTNPIAINLSAGTATTNASGQASVSLTSFVNIPTADVYATLDFNGGVQNKAAVSFVDAVAAVSLAAPVTQAQANGTSAITVTATVTGQTGAKLAGRTVNFSTIPTTSSAVITPTTGVTDANGQVVVSVTDATAETLDVYATSDVKAATLAGLSFSPVIGFMNMTVIPSGNAVAADNTSAASFYVNVQDIYGVAVQGAQVNFVDKYGNTSARILNAVATTDVYGTAFTNVTDVAVESVTVQATIPGTNFITEGTVNFQATQMQVIINSNQPFLANGVQDNYVTVLALDQGGQPLSGQAFTVSSPASTTMIPSRTQIVTDVNGQAQVSVRNGVAETANLNFTTVSGLAFSTPITFVAANAQNLVLTATPTGIINPDGVTTATITAQVTDANGAAVSNAWVTLDAYSGGLPDIWARMGASTSLTNAAGIATTTLARTQAGTTTVNARLPLNTGTTPQTLNVVFDAPVASVLLIPDVTQARADGASIINLKARVLDATGQPLSGRSVSFNHQTSAVVSAPAQTDVYGEVTVTVRDAVAEAVSMTATAGGITSAASALTFTRLVSNMTLNVLPSTAAVPADGASPASVVVTLKDAAGAPLSGTTVQFIDDTYTTSAQLSAAAVVTDATGTATITVTDVYAEQVRIRAIADGTSKTGTITFTLTNLQFVVSGQMPFLADGIQDHYVTVTATNNLGVPAANQVFQVSTASQTMIPSQTQITTAANGVAQVSVADYVAETANISFTTSGAAQAFSVPVQFIAADAYAMIATITPATGVNPDGQTAATVSVYVKDVYGAAVANAWVQLSVPTGTATLGATNLLSNAQGIAATTISSTVAGNVTVTASMPRNPSVANTTASVLFEVPVSSVQLVADQTTIDAYGALSPAALTVTVKDAYGNALNNRVVSFNIVSGAGVLTATTATTNAAGIANVNAYSTVAGATVMTATAGGVTSTPLTITALPVVNSMTMNITPSGKSVVADGVSAANFIVTVKDVYGVPISGQTVRFYDNTFSSALLSAPSVVTGANGTASITVSDPYAESVTIRALAGVSPASWKEVIDSVQFVNSNIQLLVSGAQPFLADGVNHPLSLQVNDQNGNALSVPQTFNLSSSSATMIAAQTQVTTDAYGQATVNVRDAVAEAATLTLTHAVTGAVFSVPVQFVSADPYAIRVIVTPTSGVLPDGVSVATATVVVTDIYGAVVPNALVQFDVKDAYGAVDVYAALSTASVLTSATGQAITTVSRSQTGTTFLNITLPQTAVTPQSVGINFAGSVAQIASKISLAASAYTLKSDGSDRVTLTATVKDSLNVGVVGATVSFNPTSTGDAGVLSSSTAVTDAYGQASVTLGAGTFDRSNRTISVTASVGTLAPTAVLPIIVSGSSVTVQASRTSLIAADPTSVSALTVTVTDAGGNPVPNLSLSSTATMIAGQQLDVYSAGQYIGAMTSAAATLVDPYVTTNTSGIVSYDVYAVSGQGGAKIPLSVSALGASAAVTFNLSTATDQFAIVSPYRTPLALLSLYGAQTVSVQIPSQAISNAQALFNAGQRADPYASVKFSSSSGSWGALNADPYIIVSLPNVPANPYGNTVSADFYANLPGIVTIQADDYVDAATQAGYSDSIQMQVNATTPAVVRLAASTTVVAPSVAGQQHTSTITATVTDANNFAVGNIPVTFDIYSGPGGGEYLTPVTVFTDSSGQAQTTFVSGGLSSALNGIVVQGSVFSNGVTLTGQTSLSIGASAVSASLGTSSLVGSSADGTSYILPVSALITDVNGSAVPGATLTLHLRPIYFAYGRRAPNGTAYFGNGEVSYWPGWMFDKSSSAWTVTDTAPYAALGFAAEDRNLNQILDVQTAGAPEDGYTKVVDFFSSSSGQITDEYAFYQYTDYNNYVGTGLNTYSQVRAYVFTNQEFSLTTGGTYTLTNASAGYMSTRADGTPNCQLVNRVNPGFGNPTNWYCASMVDNVLTPAQASGGSVPQTVVADASGLASFNLTYQKQYAGWVMVEISVTFPNVAGTESIGSTRFILPESVTDLNSVLLAAYPFSPFGTAP